MVGACGGLRWCRRGLQLFCKAPLSSLYAVPHRISRAAKKRECAKVVYSTMWTLCSTQCEHQPFVFLLYLQKVGYSHHHFSLPHAVKYEVCSRNCDMEGAAAGGYGRLLAFKLLFTRPIKQIVGAIERKHIANAPHVNCSNYEPCIFQPRVCAADNFAKIIKSAAWWFTAEEEVSLPGSRRFFWAALENAFSTISKTYSTPLCMSCTMHT